ncbi:MAG: TIGR04086 family membrane protein [Oscillospiraceae bacterium]|nr:TIGR04086 family membrane protein [Oscillospiraceae bacterium]
MKKRGKGSMSMLLQLAIAGLLMVGLTILSAKLILSGMIPIAGIDLCAGVIVCIVSLVFSLLTARRSPQRKFLWGMLSAGVFYLILLICNLLFWGITFSGVLVRFLWVIGGGLLGSMLGHKKVRKYA